MKPLSPGERTGFILGFIAICSFGFTLPMTRLAVEALDPVIVSMGRAFMASIIAATILLCQRAPWPSKDQIIPLIWVGLGVSIAFPYLTSMAMRSLPASHGAIVTGLLPMATAYCVTLSNHEKPSKNFWDLAVIGAVVVVGYALFKSQGIIHWADLFLLGAVVFGAIGYANGAILARTMGGMRVMCWALVILSPVLALVAVPAFIRQEWPVPVTSLIALGYLTLISQLFGMMLWYKALSSGSIARLSQVQLIQPFVTIFIASFLFKEEVEILTWLAALAVVASIYFSRRSVVNAGS